MNTVLDARRTRETEKCLKDAFRELQSLLEKQSRIASLLVDVLWQTRDLVDTYGTKEGVKRLSRTCPTLAATVIRVQDTTRQVAVVIDDLQSMLTSHIETPLDSARHPNSRLRPPKCTPQD